MSKQQKLLAILAAGAMMAAQALAGSIHDNSIQRRGSAPLDFTAQGSASLGADPPTFTPFSGSGTGTSNFGAFSLTISGQVDTSGVNGYSGTTTLDFASGSDLDASFSESSGLDTSAIPFTITGGTGIFHDATGSFRGDIAGFPTSTTTANFTMTASGSVSGPSIPTPSVPEPGSFALVGLGIGAAGWACKRRKLACWFVLFAVSACFFTARASAGTLTIDVTACIDGESQLIVQSGTAQWHNLSFRVPGNTENCASPSTAISTTLNGAPVLTNFSWTPSWTAQSGDVYSSILTSLTPSLPETGGVTLTVEEARGALTIAQLPTAANGGQLILDFNDAPEPGSSTYEGLVTVTTSTSTIPEPTSVFLTSIGCLVVAGKFGWAFRKRPVA